ncbi:MAG TPA: hypothetical protein VL727_14795 [Puia sp.]|nr:hypothetical protein [Puia sp.]
MKKFIGVIVILLTLLLTVIYRQLAGSRVKDKPGQACALRRSIKGSPANVSASATEDVSALATKDVPARATSPTKGHRCTLHRLREELPLFQLLIQ